MAGSVPYSDTMPAWIVVQLVGGVENFHQVRADHWDEIDAAYHNWYERRIDRVIALTSITGADILVAASRISDLYKSTPETRRANDEMERAQKAANSFE